MSISSFLVTVVPLLFLGLFALFFYLQLRPVILMSNGDYARARPLFRKWESSLFASQRSAGTYNAATCDMCLGDYQQALVAFEMLPYASLPAAMREALDLSAGFLLLYLERDPNEVLARLDRIRSFQHHPDLMLARAHCELGLGNRGRAEELLAAALATDPETAYKLDVRTTIRRSKTTIEHLTAYFAGWLLVRLDRPNEARRHLETASQWRPASAVNEEAKKRLSQLG
jgi:tetratricopeptide (TPR) repeat protein